MEENRLSIQRFTEFAHAVSQVSADTIIKIVCEDYNVERHSLLNRSRLGEIVEIRQVAMYILSLSSRSYNKIGILFYRDHATAMHACKVIDGYIETDKKLRARVMRIITRVSSVFGKTCQLVGPITGIPEYEQNFKEAEMVVKGWGHIVINPVDIVNRNDDYKTAMSICVNSLFNVASIALLPGWDKSPGALAEYHLAKSLSLNIIQL